MTRKSIEEIRLAIDNFASERSKQPNCPCPSCCCLSAIDALRWVLGLNDEHSDRLFARIAERPPQNCQRN